MILGAWCHIVLSKGWTYTWLLPVFLATYPGFSVPLNQKPLLCALTGFMAHLHSLLILLGIHIDLLHLLFPACYLIKQVL